MAESRHEAETAGRTDGLKKRWYLFPCGSRLGAFRAQGFMDSKVRGLGAGGFRVWSAVRAGGGAVESFLPLGLKAGGL